jgi:F-type H+-transporting ATPase subunit b
MLNFSVTFFFTLVNLAFLFFVLRTILFKPVTKFMAERTAKVQETIDQAERDKAEAKALLQSAQEKVDAAGDKAASQARRIVEEAGKEAAAITEQARAEAKAITDAARAAIEGERQAAYLVFKAEAAAIVAAAAAKLLRHQAASADSRAQAQAILDEMAEKMGGS